MTDTSCVEDVSHSCSSRLPQGILEITMTGGFLNSQLQDLHRVREVSSLASSITQMSRSLWV